jgi:hypothetical protein
MCAGRNRIPVGIFAWLWPLIRTRTWALRNTRNLRVGALASASNAVVRSVDGFFNAFDCYIRTSIMCP